MLKLFYLKKVAQFYYVINIIIIVIIIVIIIIRQCYCLGGHFYIHVKTDWHLYKV